jgi:hypothetical protein
MICRGSGPLSRLCDREAARVCAALTPVGLGYALDIRGMSLSASQPNEGETASQGPVETNSHQNSHQWNLTSRFHET